jgi:hypothetical protein
VRECLCEDASEFSDVRCWQSGWNYVSHQSFVPNLVLSYDYNGIFDHGETE